MNILLCNDDGINSPFLKATADALHKIGDVKIVVPEKEQSWIGRAYSRHSTLEHKKVEFYGHEAYTINGTPSDCVNIALSHFYKGRMPDIVFSGINIGYNITLPLLLSSGTFAAAVEGAGKLIPSFAVSLQLKHEFYQLCRIEHKTNDELEACINLVAEAASTFVIDAMHHFKPKHGEVFNVNFPSEYKAGDSVLPCEIAKVPTRAFFEQVEGNLYNFKYTVGHEFKSDVLTDLECLAASKPCYSKLNVFKFGK